MAEVFGTVASAAALAELCVKSIFKVKKLWDEVKGVSEEIERLIDDNRPLQPFLQRIEAMIDRQRHVTSEPTSQSTVQAYGNVARGLESLSASLKQQLNCARKGKRTLKKLKSTFEKDLIQSYRMRLQTLSCP
ncbi:hypothetical protein CPLU01_12680 [Colletotrichum plurivorum]|uniref:NACHT-NTPase and P-loop NTPases N-terminal domain-containing protein n=1 Tax=Colletotrichum plurivorum TaxID=2175906 RepID=A0A8H6N5W4_9PEZI|nr:hypothetical protein CPLU01_12680 [Colletotrichum plurivorum]